MNTHSKTAVNSTGAIDIALSKIVVRGDLNLRCGLSTNHVEELRQALKRGCKFPPVLVWEELDEEEKPTGRLALLDGRHRFAALRQEKPGLTTIKAEIFPGTMHGALLEAAGRNTKANLPLTRSQATDAAWLIVRMDQRQALSKSQIARKCGVSLRTVATMRAMWRAWPDGAETPHRWSQARHGWGGEQPYEAETMTDAERSRMIRTGAKELVKVFGRLPRRDIEACVEMVEKALGHRWGNFMDYLLPCHDDEERPWTGLEGDLDPTAYRKREPIDYPDAPF